jgi:cytoskeletal protein CcmA (bactofilin family)
MFKQKQSKSGNVDTLIGTKTRIHGDVEFTGGLHIDGHINGNVKGDSAEGTFLSVSQDGCVEGSVSAPTVILNGIVKGDIEASERIELGSKARFWAMFTTPSLKPRSAPKSMESWSTGQIRKLTTPTRAAAGEFGLGPGEAGPK